MIDLNLWPFEFANAEVLTQPSKVMEPYFSLAQQALSRTSIFFMNLQNFYEAPCNAEFQIYLCKVPHHFVRLLRSNFLQRTPFLSC